MCLLSSQESIYSMPVLLTTCNIQYCRSYYTNYTFRSQENLYSMLTLTNCDAHLNHNSQTYTIVAYITLLTMCFLRSQKNLDLTMPILIYITMDSLNHNQTIAAHITLTICLLRSRKNV